MICDNVNLSKIYLQKFEAYRMSTGLKNINKFLTKMFILQQKNGDILEIKE